MAHSLITIAALMFLALLLLGALVWDLIRKVDNLSERLEAVEDGVIVPRSKRAHTVETGNVAG